MRALGPQRIADALAVWIGAPGLEQLGRVARGLVDQRPGAFDEIERAVRGLVGELDDVREALARVGHFVGGELVEARLLAETPQRLLRRSR